MDGIAEVTQLRSDGKGEVMHMLPRLGPCVKTEWSDFEAIRRGIKREFVGLDVPNRWADSDFQSPAGPNRQSKLKL